MKHCTATRGTPAPFQSNQSPDMTAGERCLRTIVKPFYLDFPPPSSHSYVIFPCMSKLFALAPQCRLLVPFLTLGMMTVVITPTIFPRPLPFTDVLIGPRPSLSIYHEFCSQYYSSHFPRPLCLAFTVLHPAGI